MSGGVSQARSIGSGRSRPLQCIKSDCYRTPDHVHRNSVTQAGAPIVPASRMPENRPMIALPERNKLLLAAAAIAIMAIVGGIIHDQARANPVSSTPSPTQAVTSSDLE